MKGFAELNNRMGVTGAHDIVEQSMSNPIILCFYLLQISLFPRNHYVPFYLRLLGHLLKNGTKSLY